MSIPARHVVPLAVPDHTNIIVRQRVNEAALIPATGSTRYAITITGSGNKLANA